MMMVTVNSPAFQKKIADAKFATARKDPPQFNHAFLAGYLEGYQDACIVHEIEDEIDVDYESTEDEGMQHTIVREEPQLQ